MFVGDVVTTLGDVKNSPSVDGVEIPAGEKTLVERDAAELLVGDSSLRLSRMEHTAQRPPA